MYTNGTCWAPIAIPLACPSIAVREFCRRAVGCQLWSLNLTAASVETAASYHSAPPISTYKWLHSIHEIIHHLHTNDLPVNALGGHTIDLRFPTDHFLILMQSESTIPLASGNVHRARAAHYNHRRSAGGLSPRRHGAIFRRRPQRARSKRWRNVSQRAGCE